VKGTAILVVEERAIIDAVQRYLDEIAPNLNRKVERVAAAGDGTFSVSTREKPPQQQQG
jgi:hypothetical protein